MRGRKFWVVLLLAVGVLTAGCADSDAYPNDQDRITNALSDAGFASVSVHGSENWVLFEGWYSSVSVYFDTPGDVSEKQLATVRRVVWEQYPHRLEDLDVHVGTRNGRLGYDYFYSREKLEAELGAQDYREDDSTPPLSSFGTIAIVGLVVGVGIPIGLIAYGVVRSRAQHGKYRTPSGPKPQKPIQARKTPETLNTPETRKTPQSRTVRTPAPPPRTPAPRPSSRSTPVPKNSPPGKRKAKPARAMREPVRPSARRTFDETRTALNDGWQHLVDLVPNPPRQTGPDRAKFIDNWIAKHSGTPVKKITEVRDARNVATHRPRKITMETMEKAIDVIDDVAERIHKRRGK